MAIIQLDGQSIEGLQGFEQGDEVEVTLTGRINAPVEGAEYDVEVLEGTAREPVEQGEEFEQSFRDAEQEVTGGDAVGEDGRPPQMGNPGAGLESLL